MSNNKKPAMTNAADKGQIKNATRMERDREKQQLADTKHVMQTQEGRRFLWTLLGDCGVHQSIWHPSAAIHYNAGKQDFGHKLMAHMIEADSEKYLLAQREAIARDEFNSAQASAAQTKGTPNG